jgi:hypothetical protein
MIITEEQKKEAQAFYSEALGMLRDSGADFLLGGAFATFHYTGIYRDTKDLDVFCRSVDYPRILKYFAAYGYRTELHDVRWIAKVFSGEYFIDIIFDSVNNICRVDDSWFQYAQEGEFAGIPVKFLAPEDLIWCKSFVQNRERLMAPISTIFCCGMGASSTGSVCLRGLTRTGICCWRSW